MQFGYFDPEHS
jgi:cellobiose phosphorylase